MHDIAGLIVINATVLATSYVRHRAIGRLRTEMLDGIQSLRSEILAALDSLHAAMLGKLDVIHREQCTLRIAYRELDQN